MARKPKISLIYSPSPRSSTLPLPLRDEKSSFDDILSEDHLSQFSISPKARKSNSLPIGHESSPDSERIGFSGKEVLIWKRYIEQDFAGKIMNRIRIGLEKFEM